MTRAILISLLAVLGTACSQRPTQILVYVDAESGLKVDTRSLWIRVWGRAAEASGFDDANVQYETAPTRTEEIEWPWIVDLRPLDGDTDRVWRIEASGYTGAGGSIEPGEPPPGTFLAVARASASYQEGAIQHVYLLLRDACRGVTCEDPSTTCAASGRCEQIGDPEFFDPDGGLPGMDAGQDAGVESVDAGPECEASDESCNGDDDDCDGATDEDFDFDTDAANCGGCGIVCDAPNTTGQCVGGTCSTTCNEGFLDCPGGGPGCETTRDDENCTGCGGACPSGDFCTDGVCTDECLPPRTDCDGSCVDLMTNTSRCGGCDTVCPTLLHTIDRQCIAGVCLYECDPAWADCNGDLDTPNGSDGCETDLSLRSSCGSCTTNCAALDLGCARGECGSSRVCVTNPRGGSCDPDGTCTTGTCSGFACVAMCGVDGGTPIDAGTDGGVTTDPDGGSGDAGSDGGGGGPSDAGSDGGAGDAGGGESCGAGGCAVGDCCGGSCCAEGECIGGVCGDPCGGCFGADQECCAGDGGTAQCCQMGCACTDPL